MGKKQPGKPGEIPKPSKEPEIIPDTEPRDPVLPGKDPEIVPEKEPDGPSSPAEIPKPGKNS